MRKKKAKRKLAAKKRGPLKKTASDTVATSVAAKLPTVTPAQIEAAKQKYVRGILARGEAVSTGEKLHPGTTHEIVGHDEAGNPILKRRRYSIQ
jgi:hypothetical protein